jgi:plasmid stabilization system protein ParE
MLISHAQFVANVSFSTANRLIDAFSEATDRLSQLPKRNPWLEHEAIPCQKYRMQFFNKYYMALYDIQYKTVNVTAVIDCRQDYIQLL